MNELKNLDEKTYFSTMIRNDFRVIISILDDLLDLTYEDIIDSIFEKAKQLGFDKNSSYKKNKENGRLFYHSNFRGIPFQLVENRFAHLALSQIIQENIEQLSKTPQALQFLDEKFRPYDPKIPNYIETMKENYDLPELTSEWLQSKPESLLKGFDDKQKFITIFSHSTISSEKYPYGYQMDFLASALIENGMPDTDPTIANKHPLELVYRTPARTLNNFKTVTSTSSLFSSPIYNFIVYKQNHWLFHPNTKLVKLTTDFMERYGLEWDDDTILDTKQKNKKITKFQQWTSRYLNDSYTRERKYNGAKLEINSNFLRKLLKKEKLSLLQIRSTFRKITDGKHKAENEITSRMIVNS